MTTLEGFARLQSAATEANREHWVAFLVEGVLLTILGFAAMIVPPLASIATAIWLGWMFLISGLVGLVLTFWAKGVPGFWWSLLSAFVAIATGVVLLVAPIQGTYALTIVLGAYFLVEGVASVLYALDHRRELTGRWSWMLVAGLMDLLMAAIIIIGLPGSALWAVGLLVGINLAFGGATLIGMALTARSGNLD